jgi:hypothetical protein
MKISEIEIKCKQLTSEISQLKVRYSELEKVRLDEERAKEDFEIKKGLAEIKGEPYEESFKNEQLEKLETEIKDTQANISNQEKQILDGLKEVNIDVLSDMVPQPDEEKKIKIDFEKNTLDSATGFISTLLNSTVPLKLDNVLLYPNKIIISNVERKDVIPALKIFQENVRRIARVSLKEADSEVEETAKYLHESPYRDVWEAINGRKTFTYQELYSSLQISENSDEKTRVRNFFTNTKIVLKDKYLFNSQDKGNYELNFFGELVWKTYQLRYIKNNKPADAENTQQKVEVEKNVDQNEKSKKPTSTLNNFMDNKKIQETIYGKGI